jgi:hypothetical protein
MPDVLYGVCRSCGGRVYAAIYGCGYDQDKVLNADRREFGRRQIDPVLGNPSDSRSFRGCSCRSRGLDFRRTK